MSDEQILVAGLVVLYLVECLCWVPAGALAFGARLDGTWRWMRGDALPGNVRGGVTLGSPLPPFRPVYLCGRGTGLDVDAVRARVEVIAGATDGLQRATQIAFAYLLIAVPVSILLPGFSSRWLPVVLAWIPVAAVTGVLYWRAHRALRPEDTIGRWQHLSTLLLYPLAATRAMQPVARDALADFDSLAVAKVLCPPESFRRLAAETLRALRHPTRIEADDETLAIRRHALETWLSASGEEVEGLAAGPIERAPGTAAYCPRCHAQYVTAEGDCPDCPGVARSPWTSP